MTNVSVQGLDVVLCATSYRMRLKCRPLVKIIAAIVLEEYNSYIPYVCVCVCVCVRMCVSVCEGACLLKGESSMM